MNTPPATKSDPRGEMLGNVELALGAIVAVFALAFARLLPLWGQHVQVYCPLLEIGGVPCPTCGGTRALAALVSGQPLEALAWNPLVALLGLVLLGLPLYAVLVVAGRIPRPRVPTRLRPATRLALPLLILANWVYLLIWFRG